MREACNSCSAAGTCTTESCPNEPKLTEAQQEKHIHKVIAVMSGKGGVGKSSVTGMLAVSLTRQGYTVGILDADITGPSIPKIFGVTGTVEAGPSGAIPPTTRDGIKVMSSNLLVEQEDNPVIWRGPIIAQLIKQFWNDVFWGNLDYLLIDLPPGTGDVPITIFQTLPVDGVVIVTTPQALANMVVRKAIKMVGKYSPSIYGLIENMAYVQCPDCKKRLEIFGKPNGEKEALRSSIPYLGALAIDPELVALSDAGKIEDYQSAAFDEIGLRLDDQIKLNRGMEAT